MKDKKNSIRRKTDQLVRELNELNYLVRHFCEQAEAKAELINEQLRYVAAAGLTEDIVLLGPLIEQQSFRPRMDARDSYKLVQAALLGERGIGVCSWDYGIYTQAKEEDGLEASALHTFVPFANCAPFIRALLLPHIDELLERLMQELRSRGAFSAD